VKKRQGKKRKNTKNEDDEKRWNRKRGLQAIAGRKRIVSHPPSAECLEIPAGGKRTYRKDVEKRRRKRRKGALKKGGNTRRLYAETGASPILVQSRIRKGTRDCPFKTRRREEKTSRRKGKEDVPRCSNSRSGEGKGVRAGW